MASSALGCKKSVLMHIAASRARWVCIYSYQARHIYTEVLYEYYVGVSISLWVYVHVGQDVCVYMGLDMSMQVCVWTYLACMDVYVVISEH